MAATLNHDGDALMERPDFLNHLAQRSLQMLNHIWRGIPAQHGAAIDTDKFMSAFSMMHEGQRITAQPWPEGPDGRAEIAEVHNEESDSEPSRLHMRRKACLDWIAHLERYGAFIPLWRRMDFEALRQKVLINAPSGRKKGMFAYLFQKIIL
jgi:hypothetical protein